MNTGIDDLGSACSGRAISNDGLDQTLNEGTLAARLGPLSRDIAGSPRLRLARWRPTGLDIVSLGAALVLVFGFVHSAGYLAPTLRAVLETVMTLFALAAAVLVAEQFRQTRRLRKLLLFGALVTLAVTEAIANCLPAALQMHAGGALTAVFPMGQIIVAVGLVLAARTPSDRLVLHLRRPLATATMLSVVACGLAEIAGWVLKDQLSAGSASQAGLHVASNHPLALTILIVTAALYGWAAAEFAGRGRVEQSQVLPLFGEGALLLCAARLYSLALPWTSPSEISLREALRLVAVGFIFTGVLRRDRELQADAARAAAAAERRRVAEDLHDGLAQDLAFIAAHWSTLAGIKDEQHPVMRAARHALAISRNTISDLSDKHSGSTSETLDVIGNELGQRFGIRVVTHVAPDVVLGAELRDQVGRITREAIANAARHGHARHVAATLKRSGSRAVLRVVDDGQGISEKFSDPDEGFGIRSMRDRAAALGGILNVRRKSHRGTEVEVSFPC